MTINPERDKLLCDSATPQPWKLFRCSYCPKDYACGFHGSSWDSSQDECHHPMTLRDGDFIAQARTLLPEYIAEVEKLRDWQRRAAELLDNLLPEVADDMGTVIEQLIEEAK